MMSLSNEQTRLLLQTLAQSQDDSMDCDGCMQHMAEFVEHELAGREIPDALHAVKRHLEQCACCDDEHAALLEGLQAIDADEDIQT